MDTTSRSTRTIFVAGSRIDFIDGFIEIAGDIDLAMPRHVVDLVAEGLNERGPAVRGAKVGVVGVAFKAKYRTIGTRRRPMSSR